MVGRHEGSAQGHCRAGVAPVWRLELHGQLAPVASTEHHHVPLQAFGLVDCGQRDHVHLLALPWLLRAHAFTPGEGGARLHHGLQAVFTMMLRLQVPCMAVLLGNLRCIQSRLDWLEGRTSSPCECAYCVPSRAGVSDGVLLRKVETMSPGSGTCAAMHVSAWAAQQRTSSAVVARSASQSRSIRKPVPQYASSC